MAGDGETNGNLTPDRESYDRFIGWVKFGTVATAIIVTLVIIIITR